MRLQTGGARKKLLGSGYVDDVTDAASMMEKVSFNLMICHANTDVGSLMTVPEDTFLIYTAISGYSAYLGVKRDVTRLGTMNLDKLLSAEYYDGPNAAANNRLHQEALFNNFFKGDDELFRMYNGMQIFCPGDIVQDHTCSFSHSILYTIWHKGLYEFPMTREQAERFVIKSSYNKSEKTPLYLILTRMDTDPECAAAFTASKPVEEYKEMLSTMATFKDVGAYNKYLSNALREKGLPTTMIDLIPKLFGNPAAFNTILMKMGFFNDDNKLISNGICGNPSQNVNLSTVLYHMNIPAGKKYKFIVFSGCRNPMELRGADAPNMASAFPTQRTLPKNAEPQRRLARRLSLAPKEREESCAMGPAPQFNLGEILNLLNKKEKRNTAITAMANCQALIKEVNPKYAYVTDPLYSLLSIGILFDWKDDRMTIGEFKRRINIYEIIRIIDYIIQPSLFLSLPTDSEHYKKYEDSIEYCKELLHLYRETFGRFIYDLRRDNPDIDPAIKTAGELLIGESQRLFKMSYSAEERKAIAAFEKEWFGEALQKNMAANAVARIEAEYKAEISDRTDVLVKLDILGKEISYHMQLLQKILKNLQTSIKAATSLKEQYTLENEFLKIIKRNAVTGVPPLTLLDVLEDAPTFKAYAQKAISYRERFNSFPEGASYVKLIMTDLERIMKGQKEYQQIRATFEKRVGELGVQIQEDADRAAEKAKRERVLPQLVAAAKAQKQRRGFGRAYTQAMRQRNRANAAMRVAMFKEEQAELKAAKEAGAKLARTLRTAWKEFTARRTLRREQNAARAAAATKIQSVWRDVKTRRNQALRNAVREKRLASLAKARAEATRRRALTAEARAAENEAKRTAALAAKAERAATAAAKRKSAKAATAPTAGTLPVFSAAKLARMRALQKRMEDTKAKADAAGGEGPV